MSDQKVRLDVNQINSRTGIDQMEQQLQALDTVQIHQLGLNEVHLTYDRTAVSTDDLEQAVEAAGGQLARVHPES